MRKSENLRELTKRVGGQKNGSSMTATQAAHQKKSFQWRPFVALIGVYLIFLMDWQWAWGVLFLFWVIPDLFKGVTYFLEPVERASSPMLYWAIVLSWIFMSLVALSTLFYDY